MVESVLRRFVEHPSRKWIVIILTLLAGLVVIWPLVDEYFVQRDRLSDLETSLVEAQQLVGRRAMVEQRLADKQVELTSLETRTLPEARMFEFRSQMAEAARNSGCQVQQMRLGKVQLRKWRKDDHPLEENKTGKPTPYELRSQHFSLSMLGPIASLKSFLEEMNKADKLMHAESLSIRPESGDPQFAELNVQLLLFDLQAAPAASK